jgi:ketosteroid isomerase-like protein
MSNLEVIQGLYEAFGRGDIAAVLEALDPEIEWVEPELEGLLYGGTHRGLEAVTNEVLALIPQTWEKVELQPEDWIVGGDAVVVVGRFNARGKGGKEGSWRFAHVWKMRDGKGVRVEPFVDTLAEQRALGSAP